MKVDILIKNGRIFDPAAGIDLRGNIMIRDRKILKITSQNQAYEAVDATQCINADGCLIVPGLIDAHMHINHLGQANGAPADLCCIPNGVTGAIDAGSTGVSTYKMFLRNLACCNIRAKIMLNVSACGIIMPTWFPEPVDPQKWDLAYFDEAFEQYGSQILGLKLRISRNVIGDLGTKPLEEALKLAERYQTHLEVHTTDPIIEMGQLAEMLRPGDIITHIHQGKGHTIIKNGHVDKRMLKAQQRGVIMDCSNGKFNISLDIAKQAIAEGFFPDTISSDLNVTNWRSSYVFSLPAIMSKYLALGMTVDQVIRCTTTAAAERLGASGNLGTLKEGTSADITILELKEKPVIFKDILGGCIEGNQFILPRATIIDGKTMYLSNELFGW